MPNPHPAIVHFPVALLTVAILFELFSRMLKREDFSRIGWWMQLAGTIGLALAVLSGIAARDTVTIGPLARPGFELHQELAFAAAGIFALLLFWRIAAKSRVPANHPLLYLALLALGVAVLWAGAWYGGEMVYRHGVGVMTLAGPP